MQFVILTAFDMLIKNCVHANSMPLSNKRQINQISTSLTTPQNKNNGNQLKSVLGPYFFVCFHFVIVAYHSMWFILNSIDKLDVCST